MTEVITDKFYEKDGSDKKEMEEIEKQISVLDKKIRSVRMKYALEEIDEPTCRDAVEELEARKAELTREAAGLNEELSNLAEYVSTTVSMSSQLGTWWSQNDFDLAVGFAVGVRARHTLLPQPHPRRHQRVAGLTPGRLICYNLNAAIDILLG